MTYNAQVLADDAIATRCHVWCRHGGSDGNVYYVTLRD